jgi:hypothetical protein
LDGTAIRMVTPEGDLILTETVGVLENDLDLVIESCIIFQGKIFSINESDETSVDLPSHLTSKNEVPKEVTAAFCKYTSDLSTLDLYHCKKLLIPIGLKRLLLYDPGQISKVILHTDGPKSFKLNNREDFVEHRVKFRKFHFAFLHSLDIRIPREFGAMCKGCDFRYIKLSFLLSLGFQNISKIPEFLKVIENSQLPDVVDLMKSSCDEQDDDDEKWLECENPNFDFGDIGSEMVERFGTFMNETSHFQHVDTDGPINFDVNVFESKLDHFLDSSSSSDDQPPPEEEEEDIDELLEHLDDEEDKILRHMADGDIPNQEYMGDFLRQSYEVQPEQSGPTASLMNLFNLGH